MRMRLKTLLLILGGMGLVTDAALAVENVDWPTYYPSPYGNYRKINTTGNTTFGSVANSNVVLAAGGGRVGIGSSAPAQLFDVQSSAGIPASTMSAAFVGANGWGMQIGGFKNGGGAFQTLGGVQAYQLGGAATGPLVLNPGGLNVTIGSVAAGTNNLTVGGAGGIVFDRVAGNGPYKVAKGSDGNYYAVFAPG